MNRKTITLAPTFWLAIKYVNLISQPGSYLQIRENHSCWLHVFNCILQPTFKTRMETLQCASPIVKMIFIS